MSYIVLNEAQSRVITPATGDVQVRNKDGNHLGYITRGFTAEGIRIARERAESNVTCLSTAEVMDRPR